MPFTTRTEMARHGELHYDSSHGPTTEEFAERPDQTCTFCFPVTAETSEFTNFWEWYAASYKANSYNQLTINNFEEFWTSDDPFQIVRDMLNTIRYDPQPENF